MEFVRLCGGLNIAEAYQAVSETSNARLLAMPAMGRCV